jgi:hypothetical protein
MAVRTSVNSWKNTFPQQIISIVTSGGLRLAARVHAAVADAEIL